jgi:hypothetical protein
VGCGVAIPVIGLAVMANSDVDGGTLSVGGFGSTVLEAAEAHYSGAVAGTGAAWSAGD